MHTFSSLGRQRPVNFRPASFQSELQASKRGMVSSCVKMEKGEEEEKEEEEERRGQGGRERQKKKN